MKHTGTLSFYIGRQFLLSCFGMLFGLLAVMLMIDTIELLRRSAARQHAHLETILSMAFMKTAGTAMSVIPFAVLFGSMAVFIRMTRSHELIVARAAGISVWQFLAPAIVIAFGIGVLMTGAANPVISILTERYEAMENRVIHRRSNALSLSEQGLWIRETDGAGFSVVHGRTLSDDMSLDDVTVFHFTHDGSFLSRIDAASARLERGYWLLEKAVLTNEDATQERQDIYRSATDMTLDRIQDSFGSPSAISFWKLPEFIELLDETGFSSVRHRLHWHVLMATPFLLCAMVLVAAAVSLRLTRQGGVAIRVCAGLLCGFLLFFISDVIFALGLSSRIPVVMAAWAPATVTTLLGVWSLLHLEDG